MYNTIIRPILLYGYEGWMLTQSEETKLLVTELNILRKTPGLVQRDDGG